MEKYNTVIIGAGPCGLGAAYRLQELGMNDFMLVEKNAHTGGLATSFRDDKGFWWDIGGHVQFSHYPYFDALMDVLLGSNWLIHERESWVWIMNRFVPYPFQRNIHRLPKKAQQECLNGLIALHKNPPKKQPKNFHEWIIQTAGTGIAKYFLLPYNFKVWAHYPKDMNASWVGERVATVDLDRIQKNSKTEKDDVSWGPNNTFRFPLIGGTGSIWQALTKKISSDKIKLNHTVTNIDTTNKTITFAHNKTITYEHLISTMPLDQLLLRSDISDKRPAKLLLHSSTHIVGVGLCGTTPPHLKTKCWMYFPEDDCPFYRATVFSNYSPNNVPDSTKYWSLMLEVAESTYKPVNKKTVVEDVIRGLINTKLIESKKNIVSTWYHYESYGYPTPSLHRDTALAILPNLDARQVYSRGRFGAWKYEVSNQDHSLMQGVEVADRIVSGKKEVTVWHPEIVNNK